MRGYAFLAFSAFFAFVVFQPPGSVRITEAGFVEVSEEEVVEVSIDGIGGRSEEVPSLAFIEEGYSAEPLDEEQYVGEELEDPVFVLSAEDQGAVVIEEAPVEKLSLVKQLLEKLRS